MILYSLAEMKHVLTTSIPATCRLLTYKVNFVVNIAFRYALRATYFIKQRAETICDCYAEFLQYTPTMYK